MIDVDALAQEIRRVDGDNSLGAGALAEALMPFLARTLSEQPKDEGWIEWKGGDCPVDPNTLVHIRNDIDGLTEEREGADTAGWFDHLGWWHGSKHVRIIAYRVVQP